MIKTKPMSKRPTFYKQCNNILSAKLIIILLLNNFTSIVNAQVPAPPDITIPCGGSTTLSATTNAVTYSVTSTSCSPVAITGTQVFGAASNNCDDCVTGNIPIGFSFNYYGNIYTECQIQSNGIVGFGGLTYTGYSAFAIPAVGAPNNYIAGMYADIDVRCGGTVTYQLTGTAPNRRFVVSYNNVSPYGGGSPSCTGTGTASFQIILNENGSFNTVVSQLSANWNASTSGALLTQGAENNNGTYAFPVPGRNSTDWPGILPASNDCQLFNPSPYLFVRWEIAGTQVSTNPNYTVSPANTTTYTAVWSNGGNLFTGNTTVTIAGASLSLDTKIDNTNCSGSAGNGSITLNSTGFTPGTYTINYLKDGVAGSTTIVVPPSVNISQNTVFNSGSLDALDPMYIRSSGTSSYSSGNNVNYETFTFTPNVSGTYTFNNTYVGDAHAQLYSYPFNPSNPAANFIMADDDSNGGSDPRIVATLVGGQTYVLVTTQYNSGNYGAYSWIYTGPAGAVISSSSAPSTTSITNLTGGSFTNFTMGSGCNSAVLSGPVNITNPVVPTITATASSTNICQGNSVNLFSTNTIPAGAVILINETFSGATLPTGWSTVIGSGDAGAISTTNDAGGVANEFMFTTNSQSTNITDRLIFGPINTTGATSLTLEWANYLNHYLSSYNYAVAVETSTNGTTWNATSWGTNPVTASIPVGVQTTTITNANVGSATFYVSFKISGLTFGAFRWLIDDVKLTRPSAGGTAVSWTSNPAGFTSSLANPTGVAPTVTTKYYVAPVGYSGPCPIKDSVTIVVTPKPVATLTSAAATICHGQNTILSGNVTATGPWSMVLNNSGGTVTGTGSGAWAQAVTPTATTTYGITSIAAGVCPGTFSGTTAITLPTKGTTLGNNTDNATCVVNQNSYVHFYHSSGRLLASVNSNGQNLGNVTVTSYVEPSHLNVPACLDPTNPNYITATMKRHWVITPQFQPASAVTVRLPFDNAEFTTLQTMANGNANANDNLVTIANVKLSKYKGPNNVNNLFSDNCVSVGGNAGTQLFAQAANGSVTTYQTGFSASARYTDFSIPNFSEFWLHGSTSSPLPVTLTDFSVSCENDAVINWTTASEQNSDRFIIEKSRDGQNWIAVGEKAAAGNSNTLLNYSIVDENNWNGATYYRMRQIDINGKQEVYGPISADCGSDNNSMIVYPNPNNGTFTVEISASENISDGKIQLFDVTGKIILDQITTIEKGINQVYFNNVDLQMGSYLVKFTGGNNSLKPIKIIIQ